MLVHSNAFQEDSNDDDVVVANFLNDLLGHIENEEYGEGTSKEDYVKETDTAISTAERTSSECSDRGQENHDERAGSAASLVLEEERENFKVKSIHFDSIKFSIVTQNLNGPCPLIALVNALVLKGLARLPSSGSVSRDALTQLIADTLLRMRPENMNAQLESNYNRNLDDVINLLPDLGRGLDVNIRIESAPPLYQQKRIHLTYNRDSFIILIGGNSMVSGAGAFNFTSTIFHPFIMLIVTFRHVNDFEFTPALSLFDLLRINLYHGWLPDPQFAEIKNAIGELTYNQLVERICDENDPNRFLFEEFIGENISQLTYHGLVALMEAMHDGELAVLFRNNHFHTIHKRKDLLYLLVSDSGYVLESDIVWESFSSVDGSSLFFNSDFEISSLPTANVDPSKAACSTEADFLLAQELQACEDELARQEAEREKAKYQGLPPPTSHYPSSPSSEPGTYERTPYRNGRTAVTHSGSKEKKCTIS